MKRLLLILFLFFVVESIAQKFESHQEDWQNPAIFEKGQNPPHAFHIPYSSPENAIQDLPKKCPNYQLLNGYWNFKWVEKTTDIPKDFWEEDHKLEEWDKIMVPSNWQMEGFGHPKFRNIAISFENDPPNVPDYYNPVGCYKRKFTIPEEWEEKEIMLRFEGIKSAAYVWVNGRQVGYNQGGFEPAEFNITPFVQVGENDLSVQVLRFSDGSYLENQDMWRLSGIYRDVKLYAQPKTYIHDFFVVSDLDKDYKDVSLNFETEIINRLPDSVNATIEINVYNTEGMSVLANGSLKKDFRVDSAATLKVEISTRVIDPPKWSAEFPNLFILLVQLRNEEGKTMETFSHKIGFREVEYKNNIFTVNGVPVKLNGVNSHMHHPEHGQAVPLETLKQDLLLMKRHNINCVRTSHYPPTPEYLQMADELGVYVIDEVGDEAHNNTHLSTKGEWTEMYRDRSRKLVYRDRNHPSVIMWSAGNESGSGVNIQEVIKTGKAIDPSRPAWMYGGNKFYIPFEDIVGPRYWIPVDYKNLAQGKVLPSGDSRASFMDEYLAATGNGLGGMEEYWQYIWKYPSLTGGAIWDWLSPAIKTPRWILPDLSEAKNDGQIMGRPLLTEGKNGWGLEFSGHDDWVEFYRHSGLDFSGNQFSIGFWIKPMEIPQPNTFLAKGKHGYGIQMPDPQSLEFYVHGNKLFSARTKINADFYEQWHHIAGICNGRQLQLFIDGERVATSSFSGNITQTPFPLCLGRDAETQDQGEYEGRMSKMVLDELKVFDKAINISDLHRGEPTGAILNIDFEEDRKEGEFYSVGLGGRTYGIIWPDREVQPEIHQIKKTGQPVKIEVVDIENGILKLTNRHHFKNLIELGGVWQILVDGNPTQRGFFECDVPAGESGEIKIDYRRSRIEANSECLLLVSFVLREDMNWAKKEHEVAWEQFRVPTDFYYVENPPVTTKVTAVEKDKEVIVSGSNFEYAFDKSTGELSSMRYNGSEYIEAGPTFNVWRAPIANDIDPWGNDMYSPENRTDGLGRSVDNQLRTLGMKDLQSQLEEIQLEQTGGEKIVVNIKAFSNSSNPVPLKTNGNFSAFERNEKWTIYADGKIELQQEIIPHGEMPEMLQKIGLQLRLPKAFNKVQYYGRGPFENYPDRKTGAKVAWYTSTADSMYVPYVMPQEYGNRCDVRWLKVLDPQGKGIEIEGDALLNFSLHKYSTDNLERAMYSYQLNEAPYTILNIDHEVSGVGGTAIRQLQKYRVRPGVKKYKLTIKPF